MQRKVTCRTCDDSGFNITGAGQVPCRDCAAAAKLKADQERFRTNARLMDTEALEAENKIFRRLLWVAYSQGKGYGDDGEMQFEMIDFKRMTAREIESAIFLRGQKKLGAWADSSEGKEWLKQNVWLTTPMEDKS